MPKQEPLDEGRIYEWLIISQSYLQCALMNARVLSKKLNGYATEESSSLVYCMKEIYGDYPQEPQYLAFPILFNFKHGIEIYLKAIAGIQNKNFHREHNLVSLLNTANINDKGLEEIIEKYAFARLLLPDNQANDERNEFERYPQGTPYDDLSLVISQETIDELILDIEFIHKKLRDVSHEITPHE